MHKIGYCTPPPTTPPSLPPARRLETLEEDYPIRHHSRVEVRSKRKSSVEQEGSRVPQRYQGWTRGTRESPSGESPTMKNKLFPTSSPTRRRRLHASTPLGKPRTRGSSAAPGRSLPARPPPPRSPHRHQPLLPPVSTKNIALPTQGDTTVPTPLPTSPQTLGTTAHPQETGSRRILQDPPLRRVRSPTAAVIHPLAQTPTTRP